MKKLGNSESTTCQNLGDTIKKILREKDRDFNASLRKKGWKLGPINGSQAVRKRIIELQRI